MARLHGKNVNYSLNGVAIEDDMKGVTMDFEVPEADITDFADAWQNFLPGKPTVKTELSGVFNQAAGKSKATLLAAIGAGPVTTVFDITGSGPSAGNPEYTCTASGLTGSLVESVRFTLPVGEAGTWSASIRNSGNTTRAVA